MVTQAIGGSMSIMQVCNNHSTAESTDKVCPCINQVYLLPDVNDMIQSSRCLKGED